MSCGEMLPEAWRVASKTTLLNIREHPPISVGKHTQQRMRRMGQLPGRKQMKNPAIPAK
jgi:hypothetical protein